MRKVQRRKFLLASSALLAAPLVAEAQDKGRVYRVGHLMFLPRERLTPLIEALEKALQDLGYVKGQNLVVEHRSAEGKIERLPEVAAELVRLKVDVIVVGTNQGIAAAKQATTTIPIVMVYGTDPVGMGFVASLRRPGGNITGGSGDATPKIYGKSLDLLREIAPQISGVAFLWNPAYPGGSIYFKAAEDAVHRAGMTFQSVRFQGPNDLDSAFASIHKKRALGLLIFPDPQVWSLRGRIIELAAKYRLPAVYASRQYVEEGALMSYNANIVDFWRHAAVYVDKILKGAKPADLPVEQPTVFELAINLKTAKELGLTVPSSLIVRADLVIE